MVFCITDTVIIITRRYFYLQFPPWFVSRNKMAQLICKQRKLVVESMIKHRSMIETIRQSQASYGIRLASKTVQTN